MPTQKPSPRVAVLHPRGMLAGRRLALLAVDIAWLTTAFFLAWLLRFDFVLVEPQRGYFLRQVPIVVAVQMIALLAARIPLFVWRYVSTRELFAFAAAAAFATIPLLVLRIVLPDGLAEWRTPVSVTLMDTLLAFGGLLTARVFRRLAYERRERAERQGTGGRLRRVILVGAGRAGVLAVREISGRSDVRIEVCGFVDDDPLKQGMVIQGVPVLGTTKDLQRLVRDLGIDEAIITVAAPSPEELRRFTDACEQAGIPARAVPGFYELLRGDVSIDRFRPIRPEDLLSREPVDLQGEHVRRLLQGRRVMVTGAGGSIGAELARQVAAFGPEKLMLVERAEFALFAIDREIRVPWKDVSIVSIVADVGDRKRMRAIFSSETPDVVIHAAAHKHVPLMEANAAEAVRNNVLATNSLATIAGEFGVRCFVLVSTDKAVRPTSVMGSTKRVAELAIQHLDRKFPTAYVAVRFGNVLGSIGSVTPIFEQQIRAGGPVTVTHRDMERYFMTIPEAAQLVLEAAAMGTGGEIFVLDMGKPVKIVELAERMIRMHGYEPYRDIPIEFIGVRPGEKLYEELGHDSEALARTRHPKIFIGQIPTVAAEDIEKALHTLDSFSSGVRPEVICRFMNEFLRDARLGPPAEPEEHDALTRLPRL